MTGAGIGELDISKGRLADRGRPARLRRPGNKLLAPLHEHRRLRPDGRPHPRHDLRRPLRRDDRRRLQGLLHHHGPAADGRHRPQRRHLRGRSRPGGQRHAEADLDRERRHAGNTDSCDPAANTVHEHHWNTTGAEENCGVVAVGGGGGVAGGDGTIYFLSPEQLDGSGNGVQNAPNLYVARPGSAPHFVATLESSANAPLPPKQHSFARYFGAFANATGVAVDHATGDIYVLDAGIEIGQGYVFKFTPQGKPILTFGNNGKLIVSGMLGFYSWPTQIAVDNDPTSPSYRDFYVPEIDIEGGQFNIEKYSPSGEHLATMESFLPVGVSVDPANGDVYVVSYYGYLLIYTPEGKLTTLAYIGEKSPEPEGVAVDSAGNVYVVNGGGQAERKGTTELYNSRGTEPTGQTVDKNPSYGVAVDQTDENVFVDEGKQVREFDSSGTEVGAPSGLGVISDQKRSTSLAADSDTLDVSNPGASNAVTLGPLARPYDPHTDNPLVIDSVSSAGTRHTADFQVTPSGNDAAFTSTLPLTGYDNGLIHREVYRYDTASDAIECASCNPTEEQATGEAIAGPQRPQPHRTTAASSSTRPKAWSTAT